MDSNRYAPPKAVVEDIDTHDAPSAISELPVSDNWKVKFTLLEKAGGVKMPRFKLLSASQRMKISFNILAFLFGPIYYTVKGMWKKGLVIFLASMLAALLMEFIGLGRFANAVGYAAAAVFAVRANVDYYKKMFLKQNGWW